MFHLKEFFASIKERFFSLSFPIGKDGPKNFKEKFPNYVLFGKSLLYNSGITCVKKEVNYFDVSLRSL